MLTYALPGGYTLRCRQLTLLAIIAIGLLFIRLGIWQLHRYHEKKNILQQHALAASMVPLSIKQVLARQQRDYLPLRASGYFQSNQVILLQQDVRFQARGYDVLEPLRVPGHHRWLLVNRGWLPMHGQSLPTVVPIHGHVQLLGHVKVPDVSGLILGPEIFNPGQWPLKVQRIRIAAIARLLHHPLYPFVLRLNPMNNSLFRREWVVVNVSPQRHMSYALQWFAFAATLWVAYGCFIIRGVKDAS
tara:strand:- start:544 stop:1278 length:735 start_codon:yes stop_codon:yes gene_type:complete